MLEKILVYAVLAFVAFTLVHWVYRFLTNKDMDVKCGGGCGSCSCGHSEPSADDAENSTRQ